MGVPQPGNSSEEHHWLLLGVVRNSHSLAGIVVLSWLALRVGWVSVHIVSINSTRHFVDPNLLL